MKQKCIERRCTLERQQDLEIKKEKERKSANAIFAKEFHAATNQLASQIFKNSSGDDFPKNPSLLNHMTDALKRQQNQLQQQENLEPTHVIAEEVDDEDVEIDVDDA